ncbi:hypothetical protein [uncultured Ilumatobacter sp.]|uniref:hypothetical protein n=1 Tax=uncultured Ilumatobacter sp. TaxID=879968 RepID=UPI00374EC857
MSSLDLSTATTMQLLIALQRREVSSMELLDGMPSNIEQMNPAVNADVMRLLRRAGAIVWTKTNVPYYAGDM